MPIIIAIILGGLALAFVLYPLYRHQPSPSTPLPDAPATASSTPITEREQTARQALQEIELDYQLGNITEPEYRALRERYLHTALVALKTRHDRDQELDAEIETQLRTLKETYENHNH